MVCLTIFIFFIVLTFGLLNFFIRKNIKQAPLSWVNKNDIIKINGIKTHINIKGNGEPLIFVHGSQMNLYDFRHNTGYFSEHFKVYSFDMPGCGFSDKPKSDYSPDFFASFINDILCHYNIRKASFIASSWGGGHVLHFTLKYPSKVNKLILSSPCGLQHKLSLSNAILSTPLLGRIVLLFTTKSLIRNQIENAYFNKEIVNDELVNSVYAPIFMKGCISSIVKSYSNADFSFVEKNLERIKTPILLIWGSEDIIHPIWMMEIMKSRLPFCTTYAIDKTGHLPHNEAPQLFNPRALEFLLG